MWGVGCQYLWPRDGTKSIDKGTVAILFDLFYRLLLEAVAGGVSRFLWPTPVLSKPLIGVRLCLFAAVGSDDNGVVGVFDVVVRVVVVIIMRTAAAKSAPVRVLCLVPRESETEMEVTSAVVHSHLFRSPVPRASGTEPETEVTSARQLRAYVIL